MFAAWLETWKVFVSLSGHVDHLGSPCLCFLDYQAQISIPVISVLSIYSFLIRAQCIFMTLALYFSAEEALGGVLCAKYRRIGRVT